MRKFFTAAVASAVMLSLAACGGQESTAVSETTETAAEESGQEAESETQTESAEETEAEDEDLISFENVTLVDNDILTIELVNFYAEDVNWSEGEQNEKSITIKATNKTDHEFFLNPDGFYLDGEELYVSMQDGSINPAPGKSANYSFRVARDTKPEHTALESLDELYGLEGDFSGAEELESGTVSLEVSFSIPEALGNTQGTGEGGQTEAAGTPESVEESTEAAALPIAIGDTISTDEYEFTLTGVALSYEVLPSDTSSAYMSYPAESGKVYVDVAANVKNIMQRDIRIEELYTASVLYDGQYPYSGFTVVDTGNNFDWVGSYVAATPLETCKTHSLVECPVEVDTSGKSILVTLQLGDEAYEYVLR